MRSETCERADALGAALIETPAPIGSELAESMIRTGERLARQHASHRSPHTDRRGIAPIALVWALTREASHRFRRTARLGPDGFRSSRWPLEAGAWDGGRLALARTVIADTIETRDRPAVIPFDHAGQDRAEAMLWLWSNHALVRHRDRMAIIRALWVYASGTPAREVAELMGVSQCTVWRRRDDACVDVFARLRALRAR